MTLFCDFSQLIIQIVKMFQPISNTGKLFKRYLLASRHASKVRIQNLLGKYFFTDGIMVQDEWGTILKLSPNDWLSREILLYDGYENSSVKLAKELLKNGGLFIDIGANFGLYTLTLSGNQAVQVYAIEPNYMIIPWLLKNVRLNKRNNVTILNTALGNGFQFVSFDLPKVYNLGTASFAAKNKSPLSVLSCSLNYIFQNQGIQEAELIKIDIEGNEFEVLKDFSFETYKVKNILLEFNNSSGLSFEQLHNFFTERSFLIRDINGQLLGDRVSNIPENNLWLVNTRYQ